MSQIFDLPFRNHLICSMTAEDRKDLVPHLDRVYLRRSDKLELSPKSIEHVYFMEEAVASVVANPGGRQGVDLALVGSEGMTGTSVVLGDRRTPYTVVVRSSGTALRIPAELLIDVLKNRPGLCRLLLLYIESLRCQITCTAFSIGQVKLERRLARVLLMLDDRLQGRTIRVTHETLASMLGVRRPAVTMALHILEGEGLIRSSRAQLVLLDRAGLEEFTDGCYGHPELEYVRLVGGSKRETWSDTHLSPLSSSAAKNNYAIA